MHLLPKRDKYSSSDSPGVVRKRSRKIDIVLWVCCATVGLGSVLAAAAIVVGRSGEVPSTISNITRAKEIVEARRRVYIEKLTRTDFNPDELQNYSADGGVTLTGWRQLSAAQWSGEILQNINNQQSNERSAFFRLHHMAALAITKQDAMDALVEVAAGNNTFTYSYTKTDGTKVEQRLSTGGAAVLLLGKLEAIDYAENLQNRPIVDLNQMVTQIQTVQEPYALSQANYLRVQGYKDPVRQLSEVPIIRQRIAESLRLRRLKLQKLKEPLQDKGD
ncbi:phage terminase large subunit family protein [Calothrix sp. CCY 0018]|uniref:phage terminase large subunit family protein n=1 Tax=Calothrix sp. CCY 0018 TaxID=3103864 RepID=UPI0039C5B7DF